MAYGVTIRERRSFAESQVTVSPALRIEDIDASFKLETEVFEACGYGSMPTEWDRQSHFYLARIDDEVVGVLRMIAGQPLAPPALKLPLFDTWDDLALADNAPERFVEYGALAVPAEIQAKYGQGVASALYVAGWSHTVNCGATVSLMIMEPTRARALNRWHGFCFEQIGPITFYMGGDVAPFAACPEALRANLERINPELERYGAYMLEQLQAS